MVSEDLITHLPTHHSPTHLLLTTNPLSIEVLTPCLEILKTIRDVTKGDWKVLVVDEDSRKVLDNVVKEDDILNENITNIEQIDQKRPMNPDMDAVYILSPLPYIVDCLMADFERRRYKHAHLLWTSILPPPLRQRIDKSTMAREQILQFRVLNLDFFPREAQLITFRDPCSFPILYHPGCSSLVRQHIADLAQKVITLWSHTRSAGLMQNRLSQYALRWVNTPSSDSTNPEILNPPTKPIF